LLVGDGLRRGLKGRIADADIEQILIERRTDEAKGGSR
jgi:hypothetical protein